MEEVKPTMENTTVIENADYRTVYSVATVCLAILQKYKGIDGYQKVLDVIPDGMENHLTKLLWHKGYLTGGIVSPEFKLSSLGEKAMKLAMEESGIIGR